MAKYRDTFPDVGADLLLAYVGMETDLLFTKGIDLPGFAAYPLLETADGRALLSGYFQDMIALGRDKGVGVILESPTWVANRARGAALGYTSAQLVKLNKDAIALMEDVRAEAGDVPTIISANIGPRDDAYAPAAQMTAKEAEAYHTEQMSAIATTNADVISGYTLAYVAEAIGIVRAAQHFDLPVIISFTVETDGCLPTGVSLQNAIAEVDAATNHYTTYFMINCAHPDHFDQILDAGPWMARLKGIVANASRCSHAELDEAETLDAGDPKELGQQLSVIRARHPHIQVLGGCCGTDMRHMTEIANAAQ